MSQSYRTHFDKSFFIQPVVARLADNRWLSLLLIGVFGLQAGLAAFGLTGWQCPIRMVFGVPCPGCGLSTAIGLLIKGEWRESLSKHAFAPIFLLGFFLILFVVLLPGHLHKEAVARIERMEMRTGMVAIVLFGLIAYWLARLVVGF
jgi:hypothetical protein